LDSQSKLEILGETSQFDRCGCPSAFFQGRERASHFPFIYPAIGEGGRFVNLFKVLQTNVCEGNCYYCSNRKDRDFRRITFHPQELAKLFMEYYKRNIVDGLFLSSGLSKGKSSDQTQGEMLKTLEILRRRYQYRGYIHTKILPGVSKTLIEEVSRFSDRISINLEAPAQEYLSILSPTKDLHGELLPGLREISRINKTYSLRAGITTQLVVGAAGESDREIIHLVDKLYKDYGLWRVYYSGFTPIKDTPLEDHPPCSHWREVRLYQTDFLVRKYHFDPSEIPFDEKGNLLEGIDPKLAWAWRNPSRFPIEVNKADFWELIRIPGIGRISAKKIINIRRQGRIGEIEQLKKLGIRIAEARNFITLNGKYLPYRENDLQRDAGRRE